MSILIRKCEDFVYEANKNPESASLQVSRATALKSKSNENFKKLEETINVSEKKQKKLMK